jgi:hypothetical protein
MRIHSALVLSLVLVAANLALAAEPAAEPKVETISAPPATVPGAIAGMLQATGYRVLAPGGSPLVQIWLGKDVPVSGKKEVEGANYPALTPGVLLGVISFSTATKDFRSQPIKPGTYALRYELLPNDGNHMGVAPDRDFLLLVPVADDPGPAKILSYQELVKLSSRAAGSSHPVVFSMPAADKRTLPAAYTDANGYIIFAAQLATTVGDLPVAMIVKGVSMSF